MNIVKKILIPFDFSEASLNALNYAVNFSNKEEEMELELLHIISSDIEVINNIDSDLKRIASKYTNDLKKPIKWSIHTTTLSDTVLKYQQQQKFDLIIMGTKGTHEDENTTTAKLIHKIDCSILVVPEKYKKFALKKIALTIDKNKINDTDILKILLDTTRRFDASVEVITILNNESAYSNADDHNENLLQYYLENFYSDHSFIRSSDIEKGIFDFVKDHNIDMLTILPRNHAKKMTPSKGKLVNLIAKHSKIPVLALD